MPIGKVFEHKLEAAKIEELRARAELWRILTAIGIQVTNLIAAEIVKGGSRVR